MLKVESSNTLDEPIKLRAIPIRIAAGRPRYPNRKTSTSSQPNVPRNLDVGKFALAFSAEDEFWSDRKADFTRRFVAVFIFADAQVEVLPEVGLAHCGPESSLWGTHIRLEHMVLIVQYLGWR